MEPWSKFSCNREKLSNYRKGISPPPPTHLSVYLPCCPCNKKVESVRNYRHASAATAFIKDGGGGTQLPRTTTHDDDEKETPLIMTYVPQWDRHQSLVKDVLLTYWISLQQYVSRIKHDVSAKDGGRRHPRRSHLGRRGVQIAVEFNR